ncbi:galactose-1-phosphate uridylyltransferase [Lactobacillus helveticus]|nr:galactose-1-phosphate uridylyltransferase [Lactobacillus helveticus]
MISNICLRKKGGTSKKTKKGRIHHGIEIPCFLRQLINKYIHPNNFEGETLFDENGVEVNIAEHPVQGYTELNINLLNKDSIDLWADWIQSGAKYLLNIMYNGRCDSYNLFFYPREDGGICAKYITRFEAPPYFVGYKLSQVNDEITLDKEAHHFREFYDNGSKID